MKNIIYIYAVVVTGVAVLMIYNTQSLLGAETVIETVQVQECKTLSEQLMERAEELREENKPMDLERYRQDAIREVNRKLLAELNDSPFIDYEALEEKYGY